MRVMLVMAGKGLNPKKTLAGTIRPQSAPAGALHCHFMPFWSRRQ